jgi:hypothetical protein
VRHEIEYRDEQGIHTEVVQHELPMSKDAAKRAFCDSKKLSGTQVLKIKAV